MCKIFYSDNNKIGDNMYYSYHNIIKRKIKEGKLIGYEYKEKYKNISPVLILYFDDNSMYPIREYVWYKYQNDIEELNMKNKKL